MSESSNNDDLVFRDGRLILAGVITGSVFIAAACCGGLITAFEMDEANWRSYVGWRFGFVWLTALAGLCSMVGSILRPWRMLFPAFLISTLVSLAVAYFPCGAQLMTGSETYHAVVESITVPGTETRFRMLPMSGTVSKETRQPAATVTLLLENGQRKRILVRRGDLDQFDFDEGGLIAEDGQTQRRIVYLPYLQRMPSCERE